MQRSDTRQDGDTEGPPAQRTDMQQPVAPPDTLAFAPTVPVDGTAPATGATASGIRVRVRAALGAQAPPDAAVSTWSAPPGGAAHAALVELGADEAPASSRALPESIRDRFDSIEFIGRGGMGSVYKAHDRQLGRTVALKFLRSEAPALGQRLLREAKAQARIDHDRVCKVYDVGIAEGQRYIVMQFIAGETLQQVRERMTLEEKVKVIREVALGLHEAHRTGLVHRDVKPSNVMVERAEDGVWKPYVMDFGLAREVGEQGQTKTGAVAGTPAFMAPEQALGEIRSLDRRTDVYSLGATLYDLLAGRPPFVAPNTWHLLVAVTREEPEPLRRVNRRVPEDLEAIAMKCLEKDPARRYDSAKALADDLGRFLDGDPVRARRISAARRLWKKTKKHKLVVSLSVVALLAAIVVAALWLRANRIAAHEARLSKELGEEIKTIELFMRSAYALPLHDIERERDIVRERLRGVERKMAEAGKAGEGPGHYALGRGHLVLGEPEIARKHLEKAVAAGYKSPELHYALGLTLGELYKKALEAVRRIENPERRKARKKELDAEYRDPALMHLRAVHGAVIEVPAYVEGLIAYYEGKYEEALGKAREAFAQAPWMHEAKTLEGDVLFALGSRYRYDAAFKYDEMMKYFGPAGDAYEAAAEIGRSDPAVHLAACELLAQRIAPEKQRDPEKAGSIFERGKQACERAIQASSKSMAARIKHVFLSDMFFIKRLFEEDLEKELEAVIRLGREVARAAPDEAMAHYVLAFACRIQFENQRGQGLNAGPAGDCAIAAYQKAIEIDPQFTWALNELAEMYMARTEYQHGPELVAAFEKAMDLRDRAHALDPTFMQALWGKCSTHATMAGRLIQHGQSPHSILDRGLEACRVARDLGAEKSGIYQSLFVLYEHRAAYEIDAHEDPSASLDIGAAALTEIRKHEPEWPHLDALLGHFETTRALYLLREGKDPTPVLREARNALKRAEAKNPGMAGYRLAATRVEILSLRVSLKAGHTRAEQFDAAFAPLGSLLDKERVEPGFNQSLAEIYALRAGWLVARNQPKKAAFDIEKGLVMADKALAIHPHMARALATKGELFIAQAEAARDPQAKRAAALEAKDAFEAAFRENPLLKWQYADALARGSGLWGEALR